jgi:hypothetical protein
LIKKLKKKKMKGYSPDDWDGEPPSTTKIVVSWVIFFSILILITLIFI